MKKIILALVSSSAILVSHNAVSADVVIPEAAVIAAEPDVATEYVRVCDAMGTGYFYIPGSETCLRLSGAVSYSMGYNDTASQSFAGVEARMDVDTAADTEFGKVTTKLRYSTKTNFQNYYLVSPPVRTTDIELAYLTVGPVYMGYKETLFNTDLTYGDMSDLLGTNLNTTTVGVMQRGIAGGFYVGAGVETNQRGSLTASNGVYASNYTPDFVGRIGYEGQEWGSLDLSGVYSDQIDAWALKATADLTPMEALDVRLSAAYGDVGIVNADGYLLSGAVKYAFTDTVSAFTGVTYVKPDFTSAIVFADLGATWSPVENLDVTGQVTYTDWNALDNINTKLVVTRSF